jgi:hypothetical protein
MVKFFRGLKANYAGGVGQAHHDGIYFATDTNELLMNGEAYGINNDSDLSGIDSRLDVLEGDSATQGSVAYQIAQIVNDNNNGSIDTLNEIAAWIINDTTGAAKMASDISSLSSGKADKVASATSGNFAGLDANGNLTDSGKKASDFQAAGSYKTTQSIVSDPTADGTGITFIATASQNANGEISVTKKTVQSASASQAGLMSAADFSKLDGIESGAQVNVIESITINGSAVTPSSKGVNLGSNYVQDANYVHTDNNYTSDEKTKLAGIAAGTQVNVIETIKVGDTAQTVTNKTVSLGTAAGAATTDFDAAGSASTAESNAKSYADGLLAWIEVPAA